MIAAVATAGTHTETTGGANDQNVITTMTDPNSWRLDSPHPATTKTEATDGQKIAGIVEMIVGTVEMIVGTVETATNAVTATRRKIGASHAPAHKTSDHSMTRWMLIADSTCTKGKMENCAPITRCETAENSTN